jgi:hypothetical protein
MSCGSHSLLFYVHTGIVSYLGDPMANLYVPIYNGFNETTRTTVGILNAIVHWRSYFRKILPKNIQGITVVLENDCDGHFTYEINGKNLRCFSAAAR